MTGAAGWLIREARDDDGEQIIALIEACFAEYPGCILDVDDEAPELRRIASSHAASGGCFWVAEQSGRVIGCVGCLRCCGGRGMELKKLYVAREARRRGLGRQFCELVEAAARARAAAHVELWSDTRFADAHRLYERLGYRRGSGTRDLGDRGRSVEFHYTKELGCERG